MYATRIIPILHIKSEHVVKGVHAEGLRIVGTPKELAEQYAKEGADEIIYLDTVASLYRRSIDFDQLNAVASSLHIPLTVGGGIRTLEDITKALRAGADKVAINTHAIGNPNFLSEAVQLFGSQCIVLFIEAKRRDTNWEIYTDGGREPSGVDAITWAKHAISLGVGEILVSSIDTDGTKRGYDAKLLHTISKDAPIPIIAHGGAGTPEHLKEALLSGDIDACALSSLLHFNEASIPEIKEYLFSQDIHVRLT